jgi:hypothetical protein
MPFWRAATRLPAVVRCRSSVGTVVFGAGHARGCMATDAQAATSPRLRTSCGTQGGVPGGGNSALGDSAGCGQAERVGARRTTGISRSVRAWYPA